jgi:hypothetical protein
VIFYFYLGKVLRQLDPSQAIPGRVRTALDTMAEGLLILEGNGVVSGNASANYGGGINNFGALVAYNQTITGNHGAYGGGIRNHGGLVAVLKSSLSGNSTDNRGGAYSNESIYSGTVAVFPNSSLGGNSADIACDEEHSLYPSFVCTD